MTTLTTESDGEVDITAFKSINIEEDQGTFSLVAACDGYPDPVVISSGHEDEPTAATALEATTEALAADGDFYPSLTVQDLAVLGTLRTALDDERVEIGTDTTSKVEFYTGDPSEAAPGAIEADSLIPGVLARAPDFTAVVGTAVPRLVLGYDLNGEFSFFGLNGDQVRLSPDSHVAVVNGHLDFEDDTDGFVQLPVLSSAPAAPPAGHVRVYARTDGGSAKLCYKRSTGTEHVIG